MSLIRSDGDDFERLDGTTVKGLRDSAELPYLGGDKSEPLSDMLC